MILLATENDLHCIEVVSTDYLHSLALLSPS